MVTGASGYIGSHVCKHLQKAGYGVMGIDRVTRNHTVKYMDRFLQTDYCSNETYDILKRNSFTAVVHCAGTSLVGPSMINPSEYYINNVAKTAQFLSVIKSLPKAPVVVFSSSASTYGSPNVDLIHESQPFDPMSPYGESKVMIEMMLKQHARAYKNKAISLRYFNAAGADIEDHDLGQEPKAGHLIASILESVRDGKTFTLNGDDFNTPDGTCIRDYVHVDDLAQAHLLAIQYMLSFDDHEYLAVNLGSNRGYSNKEIIDEVSRLIKPVDYVVAPRRPGDPDRLIASTTLAKAHLGWSPQHSNMETILQSAWAWYTKDK